ncbi:MAG: sodium:proton antiporter [Gammaproteobacteria bacterium]|nr:sodium:proton antiporter [Gammaproteobacteria bacterium]
MEHEAGYAIAMVISLGLLAQWVAWRLRLPAIVLLSVVGLLAGPVFGFLTPSEDFGRFLQPVISLCVAIILFEGGLSLQFHELRLAASGVRRLVYLGVPLAFGLGTTVAYVIGGLSLPVSLVLGAIIVVTGPTVIIPMLRHAMLNRRTASYLKWEGIINDPIGALLAVLVFQYFVFSGEVTAIDEVFAGLGRAILAAIFVGALPGWLMGKAFRRNYVPEYLKGPITIALVLGTYTISNSLQHEAGLLSVTVMGIVMGNMGLPSIQEMRRFKEYITILLVSSVFILLTADLQVDVLQRLDWHHAALVAALMLVVRPLTVWGATIHSDMSWKDRLLVGWIAPRGIVAAAVAGVFAPRMMAAGYSDAYLLVPVIFLLIFATVLLHSITLGPMGRWLGLASRRRNRVVLVGASPWTTELARQLQSLNVGVLLTDTSWHRLRDARLNGVPVYFGEILSDSAEESLELNDVGTLLAATSNDAYNALVCTKFGAELGRGQVYQLPMYDSEDDDPRSLARTNRGRVAFGEKAVYEELWSHLAAGWKFHKTGLTESYDWEEYLQECAEETIHLAEVSADGDVSLNAANRSIEPRPGSTVISFGPEKTESLQKTLQQTQPDTEE